MSGTGASGMETHVKVLAVLYLAFSALGILLALAFFVVTGVVTGIVGTAADPSAARIAIPIIGLGGTALACFFLALAVPGVVLGIGLLALRPWARVLGIVLSALTLLHIPVGTVLGVYGLWVLFSHDTERLFTTTAATPARPEHT
jgi:hypothetical protein